jgi:hypothetical protein
MRKGAIRNRRVTTADISMSSRPVRGSFSDQEFRQFLNRHFGFEGTSLYHYTRQDALWSILSESSFWLSHIEHLNDASEYSHAFEVLSQVLEKIHGEPNSINFAFVEEAKKTTTKQLQSMVFVLCFSQKDDDLNQWRSYASPGNGFSLGYQHRAAVHFTESHNGVLGRCVYSPDEQVIIVRELVSFFIGDFDGYFRAFGRGQINEDLVPSRVKLFWKYFQQIAPFFKHPSFREEEEVRIVIHRAISDKQDLKFRSGPTSIVPYISLTSSVPVPPAFVPSTVTVKAVPALDFVVNSTEFFVRRMGYTSTDVRGSKIPYREPLQR